MGITFNPSGGGGGKAVIPVPAWSVNDGDYAAVSYRLPSGETLEILEVRAVNSAGNAPAGLTAQVVNETDANTVINQNTTKQTGDPLDSIDGAATISFRVDNATGTNPLTVEGDFVVRFA